MRAIPGRASRSLLDQPPAAVTREGVRDAQRQRILQATGELVAKRGYNDVAVELIVKRARVSFKTFYVHFRGKEEAFLALFDAATDTAGREMAYAAEQAGDSWPQQVEAALRALFGLIVADPATARACLVESLAAGPQFIARYEQAMKGLVPMLKRGRDCSTANGELPVTLEDTVAGAVAWFLYQRLVLGEAQELSERLPETLEFVLRPYLGQSEARAAVEALVEAEPSQAS